MKNKIIKIILRFVPLREWKKYKKRVLIHLNNYFTEKEWLGKLSRFDTEFDFYFVKNKFRLLKLIQTADYVFCFSLSSHLEINKLIAKKIYFGMVGVEFLEKIQLPPSIKIYNSKGVSTIAIAEYCLSMAIVLNSRLYHAFNNKNKKKWDQERILSAPFSSIKNKIIGIMGVGYNGKAIAKIFKQIGCEINGYDKFHSCDSVVDRWFSIAELEEFLKVSDIVIIALPENFKTKYLFDIECFKNMKNDAVLINIARGNIIKEKDLIVALENKFIAAAALDTFSAEPLSKKSKLWKFDNVIITPHIAGNINLFRDQIQEDFIKRVLTKEINNV